ncbi:protease modulator HflC [Photobacterium sp. DNB23_23_1]
MKWTILLAAIGAYLLSTCLVIVNETDYTVISQFGRPTRVIDQAGWAIKWPTPIQTETIVDKRIQLLNLDATEYGTRDRRNVVTEAFVIWKISDPLLYLTSVRTTDIAEQRLETMINAAIGAGIANINLSQIYSEDAEDHRLEALFADISTSVAQAAQNELGVEVQTVKPSRFGFPSQNLSAIYDRMESEWDRLANQYLAEGEKRASEIRADTELEVRQLLASAYRDAQQIRGEGEASAAALYADAYTRYPDYYKFIRSMESYQEIFNDNTRMVLSTDTPIFDALMQPPGTAAHAN